MQRKQEVSGRLADEFVHLACWMKILATAYKHEEVILDNSYSLSLYCDQNPICSHGLQRCEDSLAKVVVTHLSQKSY